MGWPGRIFAFAEVDKQVRRKLVCPLMGEGKTLPFLATNFNEPNRTFNKRWLEKKNVCIILF